MARLHRGEFVETKKTMLPADQDIQRLWHEKLADRRLPTRADFSIDDLRPWMGRLILADILPDGTLFFRVYGTVLVEYLGQELTGKRSTEIAHPALRELIHADHSALILTGRPMVVRRQCNLAGRGNYEVERVLLPLSLAGDTVDQALILEYWLRASHKPSGIFPVAAC
jgi:hypothetical protein